MKDEFVSQVFTLVNITQVFTLANISCDEVIQARTFSDFLKILAKKNLAN